MKKILFFIPILTLMFNTVFAMPTKTNDEIIADYPFRNRVNELSVSEKQEITKTLTACFKSSPTFPPIRETAVIWVITMLHL